MVRDADIVAAVLGQLRKQLAGHGFSNVAYCFMPDHVHVLTEALTPKACLTDCVKLWKQLSGYEFKQRRGERLWEDGYHDRILREDDGLLSAAAYTLANPVHAGLAATWDAYPFSGSDVFTQEQLSEAFQRLGVLGDL